MNFYDMVEGEIYYCGANGYKYKLGKNGERLVLKEAVWEESNLSKYNYKFGIELIGDDPECITPKSLLLTGNRAVRTNDGDLYMVFRDTGAGHHGEQEFMLSNLNGFLHGESYTDDLDGRVYDEFNIKKIYNITNMVGLNAFFNKDNFNKLELIWERPVVEAEPEIVKYWDFEEGFVYECCENRCHYKLGDYDVLVRLFDDIEKWQISGLNYVNQQKFTFKKLPNE